jgi:hypothetical protein
MYASNGQRRKRLMNISNGLFRDAPLTPACLSFSCLSRCVFLIVESTEFTKPIASLFALSRHFIMALIVAGVSL